MLIFHSEYNQILTLHSIGLNEIHDSPAGRATWDYAWAGQSDFDDGTNTSTTHIPSYSQLASGIGRLEAEDGLDQVPL